MAEDKDGDLIRDLRDKRDRRRKVHKFQEWFRLSMETTDTWRQNAVESLQLCIPAYFGA